MSEVLKTVIFHRPDGEEVHIVLADVVSWTKGEQARAPNHNTTIYLSNGQFRDVRESVSTVTSVLDAA
jgi:hypothetical protein